jgi:phosphoglycolate phosphatase
MTPACVVLDKDGTLLDAHATWAPVVVEVARRFGQPTVCELLGLDVQTNRFVDFAPFMTETNDTCRALLAAEGFDATEWSRIMEETCADPSFLKSYPLHDTAALFRTFREMGLQVAILTADDRANCRVFLEAEGVTPDAVVCGDDGRGAKPSGAPLEAIASDLGLQARQLVMVGDSRHDVDCGLGAGALSVGVLSGVGSAATLGHAHHVVPSAMDVPGLIAQRWLMGE